MEKKKKPASKTFEKKKEEGEEKGGVIQSFKLSELKRRDVPTFSEETYDVTKVYTGRPTTKSMHKKRKDDDGFLLP